MRLWNDCPFAMPQCLNHAFPYNSRRQHVSFRNKGCPHLWFYENTKAFKIGAHFSWQIQSFQCIAWHLQRQPPLIWGRRKNVDSKWMDVRRLLRFLSQILLLRSIPPTVWYDLSQCFQAPEDWLPAYRNDKIYEWCNFISHTTAFYHILFSFNNRNASNDGKSSYGGKLSYHRELTYSGKSSYDGNSSYYLVCLLENHNSLEQNINISS